ncbi:hypothetical protein GGR54DRAFT_636010 [Hypoxylon sp. NC1633]|nr:hypothetical protein GGR54DRAFT_636010 [Hypoxylon sp. NC1633]
MSNPLICYSLRKRQDWVSSLVPALLRDSNGNKTRWKEAKLDTHDAALPLPGQPGRVLRVIFLSPADTGTDHCRARVQRLAHLNGGQDVAIMFLLKQDNNQANPMASFMSLQLDLVGKSEMPVIPVDSVQAVPTSLMTFHRQMCINSGPQRTANPAQALLPYCSDRPPLPEHAVNVLTDITSGIRDLLDTISDSEGQAKLAGFLGNDSENAISFWDKEYLVE